MKLNRCLSAVIVSCLAMSVLCSVGVAQSRPKTAIETRYVEVAKSDDAQNILRSMERANDPDLVPLLKLGLKMPEFGATYLRILDFVSERPSVAKTLNSEIGATLLQLAGSQATGERNTLLVATANVLISYADSNSQAAALVKTALERETDPWVIDQVSKLLAAKARK